MSELKTVMGLLQAESHFPYIWFELSVFKLKAKGSGVAVMHTKCLKRSWQESLETSCLA